jgi:hypothetical protein
MFCLLVLFFLFYSIQVYFFTDSFAVWFPFKIETSYTSYNETGICYYVQTGFCVMQQGGGADTCCWVVGGGTAGTIGTADV